MESNITDDKIDETKDTLTLLVDYIESLSLDEENKRPLVELMKSLYIESQNLEVC